MSPVMQRIKPADYGWLLERLGLKQTIGIPSTSARSVEKSRAVCTSLPKVEAATFHFGQGFSLRRSSWCNCGALANGGKLVTPHVVRGVLISRPALMTAHSPPAPRQIFENDADRR